jgi:tetratricopeptide (TPR) repeat protein
MNIDYSSDNEAFSSLVKGRVISQMFSSVELARKFFVVAHDVDKSSQFVYHQEAVFEMTHHAGSLARAQVCLEAAMELASWDKTVKHTVANLKRKQALSARSELERNKLRNDAKLLLRDLLDGDQQPFGLYTYAQLILDQLEDLLGRISEDSVDIVLDREIAESARLFEQALVRGHQKFASSEQFPLLEERFLKLLNKNDKAEKSLIRAFNINPRNEFIAARLSSHYLELKRIGDAKDVLIRCSEANPGSKLVHLRIALLYMRNGGPAEKNLIVDHLRKSFSDGDSNLLAQFWYARELFVLGRYPESKDLFAKLWDTPMNPSLRNEIRGRVRDDGGVKRFRGVLITLETGFAFIKSANFPFDIYAQVQDTEGNAWIKLVRDEQITFELAFTMKGPRAMKLNGEMV